MKKKTLCFVGIQLLLLFAIASASSSPTMPSLRKHYTINIVTDPTQASDAPKNPEDGFGGGVIHGLTNGYFTIVFEGGARFAILDNDATDGYANVQMPSGTYQVSFQGRGKPGGHCSVTYTYVYQGATFVVERSTGKPSIIAIIPVTFGQTTLVFENHELEVLATSWYPNSF